MPTERRQPTPPAGPKALTLPVIRPIPARTLVAGMSVIIFLSALFAFFVEVPRREYMSGRLEPVGGEVRVLATRSGVVSGLSMPGTALNRGEVVAVVQDTTLEPSAVQASGASLAAARQELKAATNSVVLANVATNGSTVLAGQLLSVLAAQDVPLQAVLFVPSHALVHLQTGQTVQLRLAAYPYETSGAVQGVIERLELTAMPDVEVSEGTLRAGRDTYYKATARVQLSPSKVINDIPLALQSGMKFEASVEVERRTLLAWLVWPLLKQFN